MAKNSDDEWDYWAGTFGLVLMAVIEVIIFIWIFRPENAWRSIHDGADIRIPQIFKFVMMWVTPAYLLVILGWWLVRDAIPVLIIERAARGGPVVEGEEPYIVFSRCLLLLFVVGFAFLVRVASRNPESALGVAGSDPLEHPELLPEVAP